MSQAGIAQEEYPAIFKLWVLRILVLLKRQHYFLDHYSLRLAKVIGADESFDMEDCNPEGKAEVRADAINKLKKLYAEAEAEIGNARVPDNVYRNIAYLSFTMELNEVECRVLEFVVLSKKFFNLFQKSIEFKSWQDFVVLFSVTLGLPEKDIQEALSKNGKLNLSGVLRMNRAASSGDFYRFIKVFPESIFEASDCFSIEDFKSLFHGVINEEPSSSLTLKDYLHIDELLKILLPYLSQALKTRKAGTNIFIYGRPGTGKTELVRVLAEALKCKALSVSNEYPEGCSLDGDERMRAFSMAQKLFSMSGSFLVFDEAGDVFGEDTSFHRKEEAQKSKGWFVKILEENRIPTIWLANSIRNIDPALIRRFDMIFEMPVPVQNQREAIIRKTCKGFISGKSVKKVGLVEHLAPAVVARAASVVREALVNQPKKERERAFEQLVSCTLEAQGHRPLKKDDPNTLPEYYAPEYLNAGTDLLSMTEGLNAKRSARFCLYGPPGTGKTAFARWLAQRLDVPLNVKRGSDLISMWVGGTERNIARAFQEAERDGALLLIDEADSFLQDRRGAQRSWEITGVNEMLTQMESFSGIFVASTNLLEQFDQAALRRFDVKLKFGYLKAEQAWRLLQKQCLALAVSPCEEAFRWKMEKLTTLTPGDFAVMARRHRFQPFKSAEEMIGKLEEECRLKEGPGSAIGFI